MEQVTVYVTASSAVRKTADDCRRLLMMFDALRIKYEKNLIDTKEMMAMISDLSGAKQLPQSFVGDQFLGTYDTVFRMNEQGQLPVELRRLGYSGPVVGGENIPVATIAPQVIKKVVTVKKPRAKPAAQAGGDGAASEAGAPPPPPPDDEEAPPPPPDDEEAPPPPPDDDEPPPPPPDDE